MTLTFYPHSDDTQKGSLEERIEILMDAAERFKAIILDDKLNKAEGDSDVDEMGVRRSVPRDLAAAYNWEEIARVLREIRELPEVSKTDKQTKGLLLGKLAEVYEVLRGAKMSKLEAVRLALVSESSQLRGGATSGA